MPEQNVSDFTVMAEIDASLNKLESVEDRIRVLKYFYDKLGIVAPNAEQEQADPPAKRKPRRKANSTGSKKRSTTGQPKLLKEFDSSTFKDLVSERKPRTLEEKCTAAIYYTTRKKEQECTVDHVYTCFKEVDWRLPADLPNAIQRAGSKGWVDSTNSEDLKIVFRGENLIEHELPRPEKAKK